MTPKKWNVGIADEVWKVVVCGRDVHLIDNLLGSLAYYLTDAGHDTEKGLAAIREMSGARIIDALLASRRVSAQTVEAGLKRG